MSAEYPACDGCGQPAGPEHLARRLKRLEWSTRWRPLHVGTLLLGAFSPKKEEEFLYSGKFEGEAARILEATGISAAGKPSEAVLAEFQRGGFFLAHVLECPLGQETESSAQALLVNRASPVITRIRRSIKPKRVALISAALVPLAGRLISDELGCPLLLHEGAPFDLDSGAAEASVQRLRQALGAVSAVR